MAPDMMGIYKPSLSEVEQLDESIHELTLEMRAESAQTHFPSPAQLLLVTILMQEDFVC
jgi:hypothetical protein